jgi:hypothetical protein
MRSHAVRAGPGAPSHLPLSCFVFRIARYPGAGPDRETFVICGHGVRSAAAGQWLSQAGFENIGNIRYGMSGWPGPSNRNRLRDNRSEPPQKLSSPPLSLRVPELGAPVPT